MEDPIGYFRGQLGAVQNHLGQDRFWRGVEQSEKQAREEISDYSAACEHLERGRMAELERAYPDNATVHRAAQQMGLPSASHLRAAMLNQDRIAVAQLAMQQGQSPAALYYQLAQQRGHKSQRAINKREAAIMEKLYVQDPKAFDRAWDEMARAGRLG
jgi:hypothetical protein